MLNPLSSMKTLVQPSERAFFYRGPFHPFPTADLGFVALDRPAFRALTAETVGPQQTPYMTWMTLHTGQLLDQGCNAGKRPQVGPVPTAHRAGNQGLSDLGCLSAVSFGFRPALPLLARPDLPPLVHAIFHR